MFVTEENVKNEILKLNTKKSSTSGSIPATVLKQTVKTYLPYFTNAINLAISGCEFLIQLTRSNSNFKGDSKIVRITKSSDYTSFY